MATSLFGSVLKGLQRDPLHRGDLSVVLREWARRPGELDIAFALLGALSMREYGLIRYTEDINILVTPE